MENNMQELQFVGGHKVAYNVKRLCDAVPKDNKILYYEKQ